MSASMRRRLQRSLGIPRQRNNMFHKLSTRVKTVSLLGTGITFLSSPGAGHIAGRQELLCALINAGDEYVRSRLLPRSYFSGEVNLSGQCRERKIKVSCQHGEIQECSSSVQMAICQLSEEKT